MGLTHFATSAVVSLSLTAAASAAMVYPLDNGFETPNLTGSGYSADPSYEYQPANTGWTFEGNSGIANNQSAFGVSGAQNGNTNPDGTPGVTSAAGQAAFIQYSSYTQSSVDGNGDTVTTTVTTAPSTVSTSITLVTGTASVSFLEEARSGVNEGSEDITVYLDGIPVGIFPDSNTSTFATETTIPVAVTAGTHILAFAGTQDLADPIVAGDDEAQFIDSVAVTNSPVPEPASTLLIGLVGLGVLKRRR